MSYRMIVTVEKKGWKQRGNFSIGFCFQDLFWETIGLLPGF